MKNASPFYARQDQRNKQVVANSTYMKPRVDSHVLPIRIDLAGESELSRDKLDALGALEKKAATLALSSVASLAKLNEVDHLGGGLEVIPPLMLTLLVCDGESRHYTIEHAHTSIGYYASLATLGYLDEEQVVEGFRRSLDIPGHVSWVPGGTQANGGRLGVMVPVAVGQALGLKGHGVADPLVICHCGDAGWLSGQALDGFLGAAAHGAPIVFVMNRNGIQLSNTCANILDKDPRQLIGACGVEILEIPSLLDTPGLYAAYREARELAQSGKPALIYPTGEKDRTLADFGDQHGVRAELEQFAQKHGVAMDRRVWIPGSLMSWRDVDAMFECVFHVNGLPGGKGHHDGHMKGRDLQAALANPLLQCTEREQAAMDQLRQQPAVTRVTEARPAPGSANLLLTREQLDEVELPPPGKAVSPRSGIQIGYATVAKAHPDRFFTVSCDLDPSTKMDKSKTFLAADHKFEMGITEQASSLLADGLALSSREPQLVVFATFAAFFEGIAREGFEMWRYQRNLNGVNEGLNVTMHLSHVGACTGRDHFSGWSLDWINMALAYLPYLHRFYAPADARAAFVAVRDLAAHYGGHIIGIPRDNVPILEKQDGSGPLWDQYSEWEPVTGYRQAPGAQQAILAMGCTASLGGEAFDILAGEGRAVDVLIVNGLPLPDQVLENLLQKYPAGLVTIEDGLIGCARSGLRGFASVVAHTAAGTGVPLGHVGISDPRIAPSVGFQETWEHFGITTESLIEALRCL